MTDTLAPPTPDTSVEVRDIPIDQLSLPAENIGSIDPDAIEQLTASIKELGVLQPITVVEIVEGAYEIAFGRHRYVAAQEAGLTVMPCIVRGFVDEKERWLGMLVENLQRRTVDPVSEGAAYHHLTGLGLAQRDLAALVGRSQSHISKRLALHSLPAGAHAALAEGRLSIVGAETLAQITDTRQVEKLAASTGKIEDWKITDALREEKAEATRAKLRQEQLDAGRLEVNEKDAYGHGYTRAAEDEATHFFVSRGGQVLLLVAKDTDDDKDGKKRETTAEKKDRLAREQRDATYAAIADAHATFIKGHLAGKIAAKPAQDRINTWLLDAVAGDVYIDGDVAQVAELLGLELDESVDRWDEAGRRIHEYAATSQTNLLKALLAGTLVDFDFTKLKYRGDGEGIENDDAATHAYLVAAGYQPSDAERVELDRLTQPTADVEAAKS